MYKAKLSRFLSKNPFPHPFTRGFFYREKMRAIHRVAPDKPFLKILEVGGGQSGLTAILYPKGQVTNIDLEHAYCRAPCNTRNQVRFVCGDATDLPFSAHCFNAVTMFDVLEHIPQDHKASAEVLRVLRPGGFLLLSNPSENWRFPYYRFMKSICPADTEVMAEWGHVRRGYTLYELRKLTGLHCQSYVTFINPFTVLCHDMAFSNLSPLHRQFFCALLTPLSWLSYTLHKRHAMGTQIASAWQKPQDT